MSSKDYEERLSKLEKFSQNPKTIFAANPVIRLIQELRWLWNDSQTLRGQLAEVERERDEMAAMVGRMQKMCKERGQFITNGVELGYIQLPDDDLRGIDSAHNTYQRCSEPLPDAPTALAEIRAEAVEQFGREIGVFDSEYDDQGYVEIPRQAVKDYVQKLHTGGE